VDTNDVGAIDKAGQDGAIRFSVVICTRDRSVVLRETLETVWHQSRLPDELVIIDDGHLDVEPLAAETDRRGVRFVYHNKSETPGLVRSRRVGIEKSSGDVILFLDDDVYLDERYIEAIVAVFESDGEGRVGGCMGRLEGIRYHPLQMALLRVFGMDDPRREGQILKNFIGVLVRNIKQPTEVQWLSGSNMAYRRAALEEVVIPTDLASYSAGEDRAISYQVGRRWRLIATPEARLVHRQIAASRVGSVEWGYQQVYYNYLHFRRYMPQDLRHRASYAWLCVGYVVINLMRLDWRRTLGNLRGIWRILFGPYRETGQV
jgi:glycosyltransferase involved in cell wall biosynthesis